MPEKWKTYRPFQNWKKGLAIFLWHWLILVSFAQTLPESAEISNKDGLPTASTRRVLELPNGSVIVATDGGLYCTPGNAEPLIKIKQTVGPQQCWDLQLLGDYLFVATYNNGLYQFNLTQGTLLNHYHRSEFSKIRRLRQIDGRLFCIARYGVFEWVNNKMILRLKSARDLPPNNMPMDVFIRDQSLHVLSYPSITIVQKQANGAWRSWRDVLLQQKKNHPVSWFCNLTAFQDGKTLFLGGVNHYTVIDSQGNWTHYNLEAKHNESWAFWDFQKYKNTVFAAVSNSNDFNDGYLHVHNPRIINYQPPHSYSIWTITPSKFRDAIWLATETNGVHLRIQPLNNQFEQTDAITQLGATDHFIVRHNLNFIDIQFDLKNTTKQHSRVNINGEDRIREAVEIDTTLYLLGAKHLWRFDSKSQTLQPILVSEEFQWMIARNGQLWLFKPYGKISTFNPKTETITNTNLDSKADCVRQVASNVYLHLMGKGFSYIDAKGQAHALKSNKPIKQYTLNFQVIKDLLLIENGNTYEVFQINHTTNQLTYLQTLNFAGIFRDLNILQILSNGKTLYLYTGTYLLEIDISDNGAPIAIKQQLYLGQWKFHGVIVNHGGRFIIDRGNTTQSVQFESRPNHPFSVEISYGNEAKPFSKPFFTVNTGKNFKITVSGSHYFDIKKSIYTVNLCDVNNQNYQPGFFQGSAFYWINGIDQGKYNLGLALGQQWKSQFIIGTIEFYRDFPFWLGLVSLITLLYWVFYNQIRNQESQQKRIATLQLQTLQSNFNPHFIYNSMSLIQSLIIGSETKKAIDVTARLAKLNRLFLSNSNKELIYLKDELDFIKEYVAMEKLRFESDTQFPFQIHVGSKVRITEWLIPPLILQPLIENAIKHGVLVSKSPAEIYINIKLIGEDELEMKIVNTHAMRNKKRIHGLGIGNQLVSDRLAILNELYPNQFQTRFDFGFRAHQEYHATIRITRLTPRTKKGKDQILG